MSTDPNPRIVEYYFTPVSPWTYLGHTRFLALAAAAGVPVEYKPTDYGKVFPISGGLPLAKLFEQSSLPGREVDGRRRRAAHDLCPFRNRWLIHLLLVYGLGRGMDSHSWLTVLGRVWQ